MNRSSQPSMPHCIPSGPGSPPPRVLQLESPEGKCQFGISLNHQIPAEGSQCPWLNIGRKSYRRLIRKGVLIRLPITGIKKQKAEVYGPSVCDAKFGCVCPLKSALEILRQKIQGKAPQ